MLNATNQLNDLPIAIYFRKLPDPGVDCPQDYYQIITKPISFEQIINKIMYNEYNSVNEWIMDIDQIWINCEIYNGENSILTLVTTELKRMFAKYSREVKAYTFEGYCDETFRLQQKIEDLLENPPVKCNTSNNAQILMKQMVKQLPSEKELSNLIIAIDLLSNNHKDMNSIKDIINNIQPDLLKEGEYVIDASRLRLDTVRELRAFLTNALKKRGFSYPS